MNKENVKELFDITFTSDELRSLITILDNSKKTLKTAIAFGRENGKKIDSIENLELQIKICDFFIKDFIKHIDIGEPINKLPQ